MAEDLHHDASRDVLRQQQARRGVPEVVQPDRRESCPGEELAELAEVVTGFDRGADRSGEHARAALP